MAQRPKTKRRHIRAVRAYLAAIKQLSGKRAIRYKADEPGRLERLAKAKPTSVTKIKEQLQDRQHYREVVLERMAGRNHGPRSRMLRDRLVMVNAQIRDLVYAIKGVQG